MTRGMRTSDHDKRINELDEAWAKAMPCHDCQIKDVCRYCNAVKRIDYPPDIFNLSVTCRIKSKYKVTGSKDELGE